MVWVLARHARRERDARPCHPPGAARDGGGAQAPWEEEEGSDAKFDLGGGCLDGVATAEAGAASAVDHPGVNGSGCSGEGRSPGAAGGPRPAAAASRLLLPEAFEFRSFECGPLPGSPHGERSCWSRARAAPNEDFWHRRSPWLERPELLRQGLYEVFGPIPRQDATGLAGDRALAHYFALDAVGRQEAAARGSSASSMQGFLDEAQAEGYPQDLTFEAKPIWEPHEVPEYGPLIRALRAVAPRLRAEFEAWDEKPNDFWNPAATRKGWHSTGVFQASVGWRSEVCRALPSLCAALGPVLPSTRYPLVNSLMEIVEIFGLVPHAEIKPHTDGPFLLLHVQLCFLNCTGADFRATFRGRDDFGFGAMEGWNLTNEESNREVRRDLVDGEVLIFDSSFAHQVSSRAQGTRWVVNVNVAHFAYNRKFPAIYRALGRPPVCELRAALGCWCVDQVFSDGELPGFRGPVGRERDAAFRTLGTVPGGAFRMHPRNSPFPANSSTESRKPRSKSVVAENQGDAPPSQAAPGVFPDRFECSNQFLPHCWYDAERYDPRVCRNPGRDDDAPGGPGSGWRPRVGESDAWNLETDHARGHARGLACPGTYLLS